MNPSPMNPVEVRNSTSRRRSTPPASDDLASRVAASLTHVQSITALFPEAVSLSADERIHSQGRLRAGESEALLAVLDGVDLRPQAFESLGDKDDGLDPARFETDLLRDRLARVALYGRLVEALQALTSRIGDTTLVTGEQVKPVTLAAYAIAKPMSQNDRALRSAIAGALSFYGKIGAAAAKTRTARGTSTAGTTRTPPTSA